MQTTSSLEERLIQFLDAPGYRPLKQHELAAALRLRGDDRTRLRHALRQLERRGDLVCLRKNRWSRPPAGRLLQARLSVLPSGSAIATALAPPLREVFVDRDALSGALHGDVCQLALTGRSRRRPGSMQEREEGRVVRVIERSHVLVAGLLVRTKYYWYLIPDTPRITQNIHVRECAPPLQLREHHKAVVRLDDWQGPGAAASGVLVEDLGPAEAAGVEMLCLLRNHQLDARFHDDVSDEARRRSPALDAHDLQGREDFRSSLILTIDPEDARDFDDAVSLERLPAGGWMVGVHIADVAHFVPPGSAVDHEAYRRGNSVYLVGSFVPMLPPYLTSDICSLRPHVDRLTHSVVLTLDEHARVLSSRTAPSVIHSKARLDYDQVQRYFDGQSSDHLAPDVLSLLDELRRVTTLLRRRRMDSGSIDLTMPEVKCVLDEAGRPVELRRRGAPEAYHLIEELMLLANVAVAERLASARVPALYRIHDQPGEDQWAKMAADLDLLGVHRQPQTRQDINEICHEVADTPRSYPVNLAVLRNLKRALYSDELVEHFGLGFDRYTHFTSPIRRYPDLVVHRLLRALEENRRPPYSHEDVRRIALHCSGTERNADEAEEESLTLKRLAYYAERQAAGETGPYQGLVTGVVSRGLIVELHDSLQRGLVPLRELSDDFYETQPQHGFVRGRRHRRTIRIGDVVSVEVLRVDTARRQVDFRMADGPRRAAERAAPPRRGGKKARRHRIR